MLNRQGIRFFYGPIIKPFIKKHLYTLEIGNVLYS